MPSFDVRGRLLRDRDQRARDLTQDYIDRIEAGAAVAAEDIRTVSTLADLMASQIAAWSRLARELDGAAPMDVHRAGALAVEVLFDECLPPPAASLLAAALEVAQCRR